MVPKHIGVLGAGPSTLPPTQVEPCAALDMAKHAIAGRVTARYLVMRTIATFSLALTSVPTQEIRVAARNHGPIRRISPMGAKDGGIYGET
jgi:hypothetical protein